MLLYNIHCKKVYFKKNVFVWFECIAYSLITQTLFEKPFTKILIPRKASERRGRKTKNGEGRSYACEWMKLSEGD